MILFNNVETALKINAVLAFIGPTVLLLVTSLGLVGIAGSVSWKTTDRFVRCSLNLYRP